MSQQLIERSDEDRNGHIGKSLDRNSGRGEPEEREITDILTTDPEAAMFRKDHKQFGV